MTIQRPPILVGACFDGFVLDYAWLGASSPPSPLRQMLDRSAAFRSDSRHLCTRVITSLRSHSFKLHVTKSQVRLTALKESMQAKGRAKVRDAVRKRMGKPTQDEEATPRPSWPRPSPRRT